MSTNRIRAASCAFAMLLTVANTSDAQTRKPSAIACDQFARDYSQRASARGQPLRGGAGGALLGLGVGSLFAAAGVGAAVGAGFGLIAGGARRQADAQKIYSAAYQDCMAGRV